MIDIERAARISLHRLLDSILNAQRAAFLPDAEPGHYARELAVQKEATDGMRCLLEIQTATPDKLSFSDLIRRYREIPKPPPIPSQLLYSVADLAPGADLRDGLLPKSAVIASAIRALLGALWPSFDGYAQDHIRAIVGENPIIEAPEQIVLLRRLLDTWGDMMLTDDLNSEVRHAFEALPHGQVTPLVKAGRANKGGLAFSVAICERVGVSYVNYLRGRSDDTTDKDRQTTVSEAFGVGTYETVSAWEKTGLRKTFEARELAEQWQLQRELGAKRDSSIDDAQKKTFERFADEYRRLRGLPPRA